MRSRQSGVIFWDFTIDIRSIGLNFNIHKYIYYSILEASSEMYYLVDNYSWSRIPLKLALTFTRHLVTNNN